MLAAGAKNLWAWFARLFEFALFTPVEDVLETGPSRRCENERRIVRGTAADSTATDDSRGRWQRK